jgi:cell division protein FtsQ
MKSALAGLVTLAVAALVIWGAYRTADPHHFPVSTIRVDGRLQHLSRAALEQVVAEHAVQGFFRLDVNGLRSTLLALPWVKEAAVRRVWPGRLHVAVIERVPAARWVPNGLLDVEGRLFFPPPAQYPAGLPELGGPREAAGRVLARFRELSGWLAGTGLGVRSLSVDRRGSWRAELEDGLILVLGHEPWERQVRRFVRVLAGLRASRPEPLRQADLRYTNGLAVRWAEPAAAEVEGR